jgi:pyridoxal phosphate enzyme (YggS family)
MTPRMTLASRVAGVRERIEVAARRSGREPDSIHLVAVSKFRSVEEIRDAVEAGVTDIGESRVQEAEAKRRLIDEPDIEWHLVGRLQSNKAKKAIPVFDVIHSIDTVELAQRVDRLAGEQGKTQRVLIQVQLAEEESKVGLPVTELFGALERMAELSNLRLEGLMVLPPYLDHPEEVRPYFRQLRELRDRARARGLVEGSFKELSMGMSHDFEVAVEEGATLVRVGTALFGERPATQPTFVEGADRAREDGR